MKISVPLGQPMGMYMFDKAYIYRGEKNDMYLYTEDVPRKTLKGCINYLKKNHKLNMLEESLANN